MLPHPPRRQKIALIMVGLPARGKTTVARKLQKYLSWLGYATHCVNVGDYRRAGVGAKQPADYFAPDNISTREQRLGFALAALDDLLRWFHQGGEVGIFDATNTERYRRQILLDHCLEDGVTPVFVECVCSDPMVIGRNVRKNKLLSPDYVGMNAEEAITDFHARIAHYEKAYEPLTDLDGSYVKLVDMGRQVIVNRIEGYLGARLVFFLMQIHPAERPIWLTRHGESSFNVLGRIGGDSPLTERGRQYAARVTSFLQERADTLPEPIVFTSTLTRTLQTAAALPWETVQWRALDEIDAGICDGMTYAEIEKNMPDEFGARRQDKFRYRYPRGESYFDVIRRLEPIIVEIERQRQPVLVVGHQAVLRALYGYFQGIPQDECPHITVPLHTIIELRPVESGYEEQRFPLLP
jgi:broad specificity phosphatase PhoE/predicted kinase